MCQVQMANRPLPGRKTQRIKAMRAYLFLGFMMISALLGDTLHLVDRQDYSWKPQDPILGKLAFENSTVYVGVRIDESGRLNVISNHGAILFQESGTFVSEMVRSGEYMCLHIRKGSKKANGSRGLLLCRRIGGRVFSCLITSDGKSAKTGEVYFFAHLVALEYPDIRVTVGAHKEGATGGYWDALLKLTQVE